MVFKKKQKKISEVLSYDEYLSGIYDINAPLPADLDQAKQLFKTAFSNSFDFTEREFTLSCGKEVYLCFINAMISENKLEYSVIEPLLKNSGRIKLQKAADFGSILTIAEFEKADSWKTTVRNLLDGNILLYAEYCDPIILYLAEPLERSLQDPTTEYQVYGTKIGFIENQHSNVGLIRQFIKDPRLKTKEYRLGEVSNTGVSLVYLEQYCEPSVVKHVDQLLNSYDKDHLITAGELNKYISRHPNSIFPQVTMSERPDVAAYSLLQGKVVLFIDNFTFSVIAPITFMDMLETTEDHAYFVPWNLAFIRILRLICLVISTTLPALYVSLVAYQPEMIPTELMISVAQSRAQIPLPANAEAFLMMFALDVLVEASMRLPSFVGQTIGIVGGLVIGTAAVEAGLISNIMVIIISFTAVAIFTLPSWEYVSSWRIVRYGLVASAATLGLYGFVLAIGFLYMHLSKLDSLNKSYLYPISPFYPRQILNFFKPRK